MPKQSEGPARFVPSDEETRRGMTLWFGDEFRRMIANAIDHYLWDDQTAEMKAKEAVDIVLRGIVSVDPPSVHVRVRNSIVTISVVWPQSQERH